MRLHWLTFDRSMDSKLPRERMSCFERGKVGFAHWRSSKKRHTNRMRRRIAEKDAIRESLHGEDR